MELIPNLVWSINNHALDKLGILLDIQDAYKANRHDMQLAIIYSDIHNKNLAFSYLTDEYDFYG